MGPSSIGLVAALQSGTTRTYQTTRLGINSIAMLNKTVNVAPVGMHKLRNLLDREVERQDHERMETMRRKNVTEKTEI